MPLDLLADYPIAVAPPGITVVQLVYDRGGVKINGATFRARLREVMSVAPGLVESKSWQTDTTGPTTLAPAKLDGTASLNLFQREQFQLAGAEGDGIYNVQIIAEDGMRVELNKDLVILAAWGSPVTLDYVLTHQPNVGR